mgnify:CR=1 FL=1
MELPKLPEEVANTPDYINTEYGKKESFKKLYSDITVPVETNKERDEK